MCFCLAPPSRTNHSLMHSYDVCVCWEALRLDCLCCGHPREAQRSQRTVGLRAGDVQRSSCYSSWKRVIFRVFWARFQDEYAYLSNWKYPKWCIEGPHVEGVGSRESKKNERWGLFLVMIINSAVFIRARMSQYSQKIVLREQKKFSILNFSPERQRDKGSGQKYARFPMIFNGFPVNLTKIRVSSKKVPFEKFFPDRFF